MILKLAQFRWFVREAERIDMFWFCRTVYAFGTLSSITWRSTLVPFPGESESEIFLRPKFDR